MKKIVLIGAMAGALIFVSADARADNTRGFCNSIIATALGPAQQFVNGLGDPEQQCLEVGEALHAFLTTSGCFDAYLAGEVQGLTGPAVLYSGGKKAGQFKPVGGAICGALCGCGFFPALPPEICAGVPCDGDGE